MIQQLYAEIQRQSDKHSISELCDVYGVSRSGYYKWLRRAGALNCYERTQQRLDACVADIHAHYPMMGYRQIRDTLQLQFGWKLSDPTAWRSMKRLGVHGYIRKRKLPTSYTGMEHTRYANILNRNFRSDKPLKKIVTDVTYIKHHGKWVYLAAYLDLFNNEIVEWELSDTFDNLLIMRPAERLLKKQTVPNSPSSCTVIREFSTRPSVIATYFQNTMSFRVCQGLETLTTTLSWKASGADSRILCANTSATGKKTICTP